MTPPWLIPMLVLVLACLGAGRAVMSQLNAHRNSVAQAAQATRQAKLAADEADRLAAQVAAGMTLDRDHSALLDAWESTRRSADQVAAEAVRLAQEADLLVISHNRTTPANSPVTTGATGAAEPAILEFTTSGTLAGILTWIDRLETDLEPAALRRCRLQPGLPAVRAQIVLVQPTDLP